MGRRGSEQIVHIAIGRLPPMKLHAIPGCDALFDIIVGCRQRSIGLTPNAIGTSVASRRGRFSLRYRILPNSFPATPARRPLALTARWPRRGAQQEAV